MLLPKVLIRALSKSILQNLSDVLCGDDQWVNVMHADGAGTNQFLLIYTGKRQVMFQFGKGSHKMRL
jgi:hypothetical protein